MSNLLESILDEIEEKAKIVRERIEKNNSPGLTTANDKHIVLKFLDDLMQHELARQAESLRATINLVRQYFLPPRLLGMSSYDIARYLWTNLAPHPQLRELIPHVTRGLITHRAVMTNVNPEEWLLLASLKATLGPKLAKNRKVRISHDVLEARVQRISQSLLDYHDFLRQAGLTIAKESDDNDGTLYLVVRQEVLDVLREADGRDEQNWGDFPLEIFDVFLYSSWIANAQALDPHFVNVVCGLIALFTIFGLLSVHDVVSGNRSRLNMPSKSYIGYLMEQSYLFLLMVPLVKLVALEIFGPQWVQKIYSPDHRNVGRLNNCYMIFRELCITVNQGIIQSNHAILEEIVKSRVDVDSTSGS